MRVSTNMLTFNFMTSLNSSLERQNSLQEKLSDGKAIHRPSDDPVRTVRSLRFNINLRENEQYTQNVKDAMSWLETTDGAMSDLSSLTIKAKELVVKAANPNPDVALKAIGQELDGIINQMIQIGNTKIGDRYVFAGQNDKIQPFQRRMITPDNGAPYETVVYTGDSNKISMRIQPGSVTPSQDSVNLTGEDVFGPLTPVTENGKTIPTAGILNNLLQIKNALMGNQPSPKSNPIGGDITMAAGQKDFNAFTLRVDSIGAGGLPDKVSYSLDGGVSWANAANIAIAGDQVTITDEKGLGTTSVQFQFQAAAAPTVVYKAGDTYTLPQATSGTDVQWISKSALYLVDNAHDHMLQAHTGIGARMSMYTQAQALLEKDNVIITSDVAANEDLDIPKAMIDFKTSESVYRTALSLGARLMPPSLADFLK